MSSNLEPHSLLREARHHKAQKGFPIRVNYIMVQSINRRLSCYAQPSNIDARAATFNRIGGHQTIITYQIGTLVTPDAEQQEAGLRKIQKKLNLT